jgi:DNA-binding transcriptional LysR family regulator
MKLKHLEILHAVLATGTLSAAARLLHISQPAATQALQLAELQLGYALFTRQANRLVPTAEALALQPAVQSLMAQLDGVRRLAAAQRQGAASELRLLVVPSLAVLHLPRALVRWRSKHASVGLRVRTLHTREITRAIALREADLGIVYGGTAPPAADAVQIAQGRLVRAAPAALAGRLARLSLAQALAEPCIRIDEQDPIGILLAEHCARLMPAAGAAIEPPASGGTVVQTHHAALALAEQGIAPALVDSFTAAAARPEAGLVVQAIEPPLPLAVWALLPPGPRSPPAATALLRALREVCERFGGTDD